MKSVGIVLAAGSGTRMNTDTPKQYMDICGVPMVCHSLRAMEESDVDEVVLVVPMGDVVSAMTDIVEAYGFDKVTAVCEGGSERYFSVYNGLENCECEEDDIVLIHDCARPMVTPELINSMIEGTVRYGACSPAVAVKDTIRYTDAQGYAGETLDRSQLVAMQTPQTFRYGICMGAYEAFAKGDIDRTGTTDDVQVVERMTGVKSMMLPGDYRNIKVTTPEDVLIAEAYLMDRKKRIEAKAAETGMVLEGQLPSAAT